MNAFARVVDTSSLTRVYDSLGRPAGIALGAGYLVQYGHDATGRLASVAWTVGGTTRTAAYAYVQSPDLIGGYDIPVGTNVFRVRKTVRI